MSDPKKTNIDPAVEPDIPPPTTKKRRCPKSTSSIGDRGRFGRCGIGRDVIARFAKLAPSSPGVYRMAAANGDVLYVGKAKNIKKRILAYARPTGHVSRALRA